MFLDMSSSTAIAEELGHERYFTLLKSYYEDMTTAILETSGRINQYVGDEIVISWPEKLGLYKSNCLECFAKIARLLDGRSHYYRKTFGLVPAFKAGFHIGSVTVGEIGIIKKELIYTGDVLNTTARITALCGEYGTNALISGTLLDKLPGSALYVPTRIGALKLRGKKEAVELFKLDFNG
jgi:adenylate cyclase